MSVSKRLGVRLIDTLRRMWFRFNYSEMEILAMVLPSQGYLVDVGAHFGTSSRPFLLRQWSVDAFEPDAKNRKHLAALGARFPAQLTIHDAAVSDTHLDARAFFRSDVSSGISGLEPFHPSHTPVGHVETVALETFLPTTRPFDVLKVDVEGHELAVLRGVDWATQSPRVVMCEFDDAKVLSNDSPTGQAVSEFLRTRGYDVVVSEWDAVDAYGSRHRPRSLHHGVDAVADKAWGNVLAFIDPQDAARFQATAEPILNRARLFHPVNKFVATCLARVRRLGSSERAG